jgi:uncharacterized membrane protein
VVSEYDEGVAAGKILERLDHHDRHFEVINGSIVDGKNATVSLRDEIHALRLAIQQLADQAKASAEATIKTAAALKDAQEAQRAQTEAQRAQGEQKWSPVAKTITVILAVATVAGVMITLLSIR